MQAADCGNINVNGKAKTMKEYDIVMSFAGEDRKVAEELASRLVSKGINVFYDEYEKANLWGKDLYTHLIKIYRDDSKYYLMILSESYAKKQWTNHERKAAQSRAFAENQEYILPLRLDETEIEGVLNTTGYIDYKKTDIEEIIDLITKKIYKYNKDNNISYSITYLEEVFAKQYIDANGVPLKDKDFTTQCPTCQIKQNLSDSVVSLDNDDTIYTCKNGCQPLVIISRPGIVAWPGRGYKLGNHVVRNAQDLLIKANSTGAALSLLASKAALMKKKPNS
ncbi:toll/interleukin-1 receptor domain-containing protein [Hymenobacter coccineus]|uniref:toll/interleukin-1 receptor domain-containing protein n=1 Tax=Hymenobacter coccineus TaxID=1908235 RepID=UPI000B10A5D4|nr:TIR domain-containing protein [Hymenobacter coccineus]